MSKKAISVVGGTVFLAGFALAAFQGCGGGGSTDYAALCQKTCQKEATCYGDSSLASECTSTCTTQANQMGTCTNASTITSDVNACLAMSDCTAFQNCLDNVPDCAGGTTTGTGGSSGTGGTTSTGTGGSTGAGGSTSTGTGGSTGTGTGTGGTSGTTASCSICDKAQTCCLAVIASEPGGSASDCSFSNATCGGLTGTNQSEYITACQTILTEGAALGGGSACQ